MLYGFGPVIDKNTTRLVVGTMPSAASLAAARYYGHPMNKFWPIVFEVFAGTLPPADYDERLRFILLNRVGLWDSLKSCEREGSLDKDIRSETPNDFRLLLSGHGKVKRLLFNGHKAGQYFMRYIGKIDGIEYTVLPSTSPANASVDYGTKLKRWREAFLLP